MRSTSLFLVAAAFALLMLPSGRARAQNYGYGPRIPPQYAPGYRPSLSPYLNLLRGGDLSANYFLGVRPEIQRREDRANFQTRARELENRTEEIENEEEQLIQGTASDFGDTGNYFASPNTYYGRANPASINQGRPPSRQRRGH